MIIDSSILARNFERELGKVLAPKLELVRDHGGEIVEDI